MTAISPEAQTAAPGIAEPRATDYTADRTGHDESKPALHPAIADQIRIKQAAADAFEYTRYEDVRRKIIPQILAATAPERAVLAEVLTLEDRLQPEVLRAKLKRANEAVAASAERAEGGVGKLITHVDEKGGRDHPPVVHSGSVEVIAETGLLLQMATFMDPRQAAQRLLSRLIARALDNPNDTRPH